MELSNRISLNFPSSSKTNLHNSQAREIRRRYPSQKWKSICTFVPILSYPFSISFEILLESPDRPNTWSSRMQSALQSKMQFSPGERCRCNKKCRTMSGKWGFLRERDIEVAASKRRMRFAVAKFCNAKRTRDKTSRL